MKHKFYTSEDCETEQLTQMVVEGGLQICSICGLLEGALTTDCPNERAVNKMDDIYAGKLDFREGEGWVEKLNPTNQTWDKGRKLEAEKKENRNENSRRN